MNPTYCFRRLGGNESIEGENNLQFVGTSNGGELGPDLASRCVPVWMWHEGTPADRPVPAIGDLLKYTEEHRTEIIAELMGMVDRWREAGSPIVPVAFREQGWASTLNGVLKANGIEGFLSTYQQDRDGNDELSLALGELAATRPGEFLRAADWAREMERLGLYTRELSGRTARGQQIVVGNLLGSAKGRAVTAVDPDTVVRRTFALEVRSDRNGKRYGFVETAESASQVDRASTGPVSDVLAVMAKPECGI